MCAQTTFAAIRVALRNGDDRLAMKLLLEEPNRLQEITPFGTWLHAAASFGRLAVVKDLVSRGCDVNQKSGIFNGAPINEAASNGHKDVVRYLLAANSTLDTSEPERNPLFGAIYGGHLDIAQILISAGIDYEIKYSGESMKNMDALAFAEERGQEEIAHYLKSIIQK